MTMLRTTLGGALAGTAQALSLASKLLDATAKTLRRGVDEPPRSPAQRTSGSPATTASEPLGTEATILDLTSDVEVGRVVEPPATPLLDETPHVRTSESHVEELAAQPATAVVSAVADLSTDELRLLTEYEMSHKNRRTVLAAIEKALAPA